MKVRHGFVSNSSSTSFLIHTTDANRHLVHHNYTTVEKEYIWPDTDYSLKRESQLKYFGWKFYETEELGYGKVIRIYERERPLWIINNLGRATGMAYGEYLDAYLQMLDDEWLSDIASRIGSAIKKYGLDNVLLLRESDESMGGDLPPELAELTRSTDVIDKFEYH